MKKNCKCARQPPEIAAEYRGEFRRVLRRDFCMFLITDLFGDLEEQFKELVDDGDADYTLIKVFGSTTTEKMFQDVMLLLSDDPD